MVSAGVLQLNLISFICCPPVKNISVPLDFLFGHFPLPGFFWALSSVLSQLV
jgi:hypothetical protein